MRCKRRVATPLYLRHRMGGKIVQRYKKSVIFSNHTKTHTILAVHRAKYALFYLLTFYILTLQCELIVAHIIVESVYIALHLLHITNESTLAQSVVYLHRSASPPPYRKSMPVTYFRHLHISLRFWRGPNRACSQLPIAHAYCSKVGAL